MRPLENHVFLGHQRQRDNKGTKGSQSKAYDTGDQKCPQIIAKRFGLFLDDMDNPHYQGITYTYAKKQHKG